MNSIFSSEIKGTFPAVLRALVFVLFLVKTSNAQINIWQKQNDIGADFPDGPPFNGPSDMSFYGIGLFRFVFGHKVVFGVTVDKKNVQVYEYDKRIDRWLRKSDMPAAELNNVFHFTVNGKGYVGGGWLGGKLSRKFWEYNSADETWKEVANVPEDFTSPFSFAGNQKGYVIQNGSRSVYEYSPGENQWRRKKDFPGPIREYDACGFVIGNSAFMGLGHAYDVYPKIKFLKDFWKYSPDSDAWTRIADFPDTSEIAESVGYSFRGYGYIGYGRYWDGLRPDRNTRVWKYDPTRNIWSLSDISFVDKYRNKPFFHEIDGELFAGFGFTRYPTENDRFNSVKYDWWKFDASSLKWKEMSPMGISRSVGFSSDNACALLDKGYLLWEYIDFETEKTKLATFVYSASTGEWNRKSFFPSTAVESGNSLFKAGGNIYSIGGSKSEPVPGTTVYRFIHSKVFYQYDPVGDRWIRKPDFPGKARSNAKIFEIKGKAYVAYGYSEEYNGLNYLIFDLWEFDPLTDRWTRKADPPPVNFVEGVFQSQDKAYIMCALAGATNAAKVVFEYDPITNKWERIGDFPGEKLPIDYSGNMIGLTVGNDAFIIGGLFFDPIYRAYISSKELWKFDGRQKSFSRLPNLPQGMSRNMGFAIGNRLFTGATGGNSRDWWSYETAMNLPGGTVGVTGDRFRPSDSVEIRYSFFRDGFNAGNKMVIQLSDGNGKFEKPFELANYSFAGGKEDVKVLLPKTINCSDQYRLRVISTSPTDTTYVSDPFFIGSLLSLQISTQSNLSTICNGSELELSAPQGTGYTYTWLKDNVIVNGASGNTYKAKQSGMYAVRVSTPDGCLATSPSFAVTLTNPPEKPVISASGSVTFCTGQSLFLKSSSISGNAWYRNDTLMAGEIGQEIQVSQAGQYTVRVNAGSCSSAFSDPVKAVVIAAPAVPVISSGGANSICAGSSLQLSVSTVGTYQWLKDGVALPGETKAMLSVTSAGKYSVRVFNAAGCSATSVETAIAVLPLPPKPTILEGANLSSCAKVPVQLTSSSVSGNQWSRFGVDIPGATGAAYTTTDSGTYTVRVTNTNGCYQSSAPTTVKVLPSPAKPDITPKGQVTLCSGSSIELRSDSVYGSQWLRNGSPITGGTGARLSVSQAGQYSLRITGSNGCISTSDVTTVALSSTPPVPSITAATSTSICEGSKVVLVSSSVSSNQWFRDGLAINEAVKNIYEAGDAGDYSVRVTNAAGCHSVSSIVKVSVQANPPIPQISADGPLSFCEGGKVVLNSSASQGNQWIFNGVPISGASSSTLDVFGTGDYQVRTTGAGGCKSTSSVTTVAVNQFPPPAVITATGSASICPGSQVRLGSSVSSGNQWYKDGNAIAGATSSSFDTGVPGQYAVRVTSAAGCTSAFSNAIEVKVNTNPPKPVISWNGNSLSTQAGYASYKWYRDGSEITGAIGSTYQPQQTGIFRVVVFDASNCSTASDDFNLVITGLADIQVGNFRVRYYPNPARDQLSIVLNNPPLEKIEARIYDMHGRLMTSIYLRQKNNPVSVSRLPSGTYFLQILSAKERAVVRISIIK